MAPKQYAIMFWSVTVFGFTSMSLMVLWLCWGLYAEIPAAMSSSQDLCLFFVFVSITVYTIYALLSIVISSIKLYLKYSEEMRKNAKS